MREAARRTQCRNNLKQMALAEHNYHDVNSQLTPAMSYTFPPIIIPPMCCPAYGGTPGTAGQPYTPCPCKGSLWISSFNYHYYGERLLPFLEATNVYRRILHERPDDRALLRERGAAQCEAAGLLRLWQAVHLQEHHEPVQRRLCEHSPGCGGHSGLRLPVFAAHYEPVRRDDVDYVLLFPRTWIDVLVWPPVLAGASDYVSVGGYNDCGNSPLGQAYLFQNNCQPELYKAGPINVFQFNVSIDKITDGTSTTALFAELAGRPDPVDSWREADGRDRRRYSASARNWGGCWACIDNTFQIMIGSGFQGSNIPTGTQAHTGTPVCFLNCINTWSLNWYSFHPGSVGIALCDGSARMISENTSITVLARMQSYKGGKPVLDSSF